MRQIVVVTCIKLSGDFAMSGRPKKISSEGLYPPKSGINRGASNLAMGILMQAFRDVLSPQYRSEKDWAEWRRDSLAWFKADDHHTGSYFWVCDVLGLDPKRVNLWLKEAQKLEPETQKTMVANLLRLRLM